MRKVCVYIACSIDGYIAKTGDNLDFLKIVEREGEDYGYAEFNESIDTILIGRKTYDWVAKEMGTTHYDNGDRDVIVFTRTERTSFGRTRFYSGDLSILIQELREKTGKNIYCDGGAEMIHALLNLDLVDEMTISYIPIMLGNGTKLFKDERPEQLWQFQKVSSFESGLVQMKYVRMRN